MNYSEIIKLLDAGYTRDEIMNMNENGEEPENKDAAGSEQSAGADELSKAVNDMKAMFSDFTKEIAAMNIMNSQQSADKENTVDEIIANIISPSKNKKE